MSIFTGDSISEDRTLRCDVCVVGSGAGGAVMAQRLAAAGKKVIVLEDGGFHTSESFTLNEADAFERLYQSGGARNTEDLSISFLQGRSIGGSTTVNWTTCFRTPGWVREHWARHCGATDLAAALPEHFEDIEKRLNVHQMLLSQINANNRVLWDGATSLGFDVELLHRNVKQCNHTGYCGMGCPIDAKQSMLATFIPDAVKLGADFYANAWVSHLQHDGRRITRAVAKLRDPKTDTFNGVTLTVEAKQFVLSGGAVNTPALLLRSELDSNGRTGKRTFLHPTVLMSGEHGSRIEGFKGSPQYVGCSEFARRGPGKLGFLMEASPTFPMASSQGFNFGLSLHRYMKKLPYLSTSIAIISDGFEGAGPMANDVDGLDPEEGGSVSIGKSGAPVLNYNWSPQLTEALRFSAMQAARVQFAAGAKQVYLVHAKPVELKSTDDIHRLEHLPFGPRQVGAFSAHVMGGCTMGTDPKTSVVDSASFRHHDHDNLFVADGSVLPTSATVNPQITIYGLASWASQWVLAAG